MLSLKHPRLRTQKKRPIDILAYIYMGNPGPNQTPCPSHTRSNSPDSRPQKMDDDQDIRAFSVVDTGHSLGPERERSETPIARFESEVRIGQHKREVESVKVSHCQCSRF